MEFDPPLTEDDLRSAIPYPMCACFIEGETMPKVKVKVTPDEPVEINAQKVGMLFEMIGDVAKQTGNKASCKMVAPDFTVTIIVKPTEKK